MTSREYIINMVFDAFYFYKWNRKYIFELESTSLEFAVMDLCEEILYSLCYSHYNLRLTPSEQQDINDRILKIFKDDGWLE